MNVLNKVWEGTSNVINGTKNKIYDYTVGAVAHSDFFGKGIKSLRSNAISKYALHGAVAIGGAWAGSQMAEPLYDRVSTMMAPVILSSELRDAAGVQDVNQAHIEYVEPVVDVFTYNLKTGKQKLGKAYEKHFRGGKIATNELGEMMTIANKESKALKWSFDLWRKSKNEEAILKNQNKYWTKYQSYIKTGSHDRGLKALRKYNHAEEIRKGNVDNSGLTGFLWNPLVEKLNDRTAEYEQNLIDLQLKKEKEMENEIKAKATQTQTKPIQYASIRIPSITSYSKNSKNADYYWRKLKKYEGIHNEKYIKNRTKWYNLKNK